MVESLLGLVPLHMGALHPYERLVVLLIAFGPFVVLAAVVFFARRRDVAAERGRDPEHERDATP